MGEICSHPDSIDLQRAWHDRDYGSCCEILTRAATGSPGAACPPETLKALARALMSMPADPSDPMAGTEAARAFRSLRTGVLDRAATLDPSFAIALRSTTLASRQSAVDWTADMLRYIVLRSAAIGERRERLWENAALIHWCVGRLLSAARLDASGLAVLLTCLLQTDSHPSWEAPGRSIQKDVLADERKSLQDGFV